jgi:hypothetical protein
MRNLQSIPPFTLHTLPQLQLPAALSSRTKRLTHLLDVERADGGARADSRTLSRDGITFVPAACAVRLSGRVKEGSSAATGST